MSDEWYFDVTSDEYDTETHGGYGTEDEALAGMRSVQKSADELNDGVERWYSGLYVDNKDDEGEEDNDEGS